MIKKTVTYTDYNDIQRTETFHFHFTETEILEMEMSVEGGFGERIQRIIDAKDQTSLMKVVTKFVRDAYGVKSEDGKRFIKNEKVLAEFVECPAYSMIFMELITNDELAAEFVNGVIPDSMKKQFAAIAAKNAKAE